MERGLFYDFSNRAGAVYSSRAVGFIELSHVVVRRGPPETMDKDNPKSLSVYKYSAVLHNLRRF